jgi:hypothetical protein
VFDPLPGGYTVSPNKDDSDGSGKQWTTAALSSSRTTPRSSPIAEPPRDPNDASTRNSTNMAKTNNNKTEHRHRIRTRTPATGWTRKTEIEALLASGVPREAVTHLRWQDIEVAESVLVARSQV